MFFQRKKDKKNTYSPISRMVDSSFQSNLVRSKTLVQLNAQVQNALIAGHQLILIILDVKEEKVI